MKKIINILLATLVLTGVSTVSAHAGEDQATYAVVNSAGVVTNVIVCGPAVCGPGGSWGGVMPADTPFPGQKLVLQIPVNPVTGQNQGSVFTQNPTAEQVVRYDSQAQVFTQGSSGFPAPVDPLIRTEVVDTTTISATISSDVVTFGPNSFVNGTMQFTPKVDSNTIATISAIQGTVVERQTFATPKTKLQIEQSIQGRLTLIQKYLNRFYILLNGWVID
jgi:hypothetical protein